MSAPVLGGAPGLAVYHLLSRRDRYDPIFWYLLMAVLALWFGVVLLVSGAVVPPNGRASFRAVLGSLFSSRVLVTASVLGLLGVMAALVVRG